MKRKCKLLAILTIAILLLTSAAVIAEEIIIIEDIPMGDVYQGPTGDAPQSQHQEEVIEISDVPFANGGSDGWVFEDEEDADDEVEDVVPPFSPETEEDDEAEVITAPQIVAEDEEEEEIELIAPPQIAPEADEDEEEEIEQIAPPQAAAEQDAEAEEIVEFEDSEEDSELIVVPAIIVEVEEVAETEAEAEEEAEPQTAATISYTYEGDKIFLGDVVTFTAHVEEGATVQWQHQSAGSDWTDISGATGTQFQVTVTTENADNNWRCMVIA